MRPRRSLGGRLLLGALAWPPLLLLAAGLFWFLSLPWPLDLRWRDPERTAYMAHREREARKAGEELEIQRAWVPLEEISPLLRRAVLAAEDDRFYQHRGIDWRALAEEVGYQGDTTFSFFDAGDRRALRRALAYYRAHRDEIRGRSTITQQLARNLYLSPERSLLRKLNEAVLARRLERFLTKDRILELYLNVVELGPGIFGAEAAARAYFGKGAREVSLEEAAALAATLPHPLTSNPAFRPSRMEWRKKLLLERLRGPALERPPPGMTLPGLSPEELLPPPPPDRGGVGGEAFTPLPSGS